MTSERDRLLAQIAEHQQAMGLAMVAHKLQHIFEGRLSASRLHALAILDALGPQPAGELARHLDITAATTTGLVDALVRDGLAERRTDPDDGRARIIHATEAGVQAWREAIMGPTAIDEEVLARLTDADLDLLVRATAVLRRAVTDVTESR